MRFAGLGSILITAALSAVTPRAAEPPAPIPAGGAALVPADPLTAFGLRGAADVGNLETVDASGPTFTRALRVRTSQRPTQTWDLSLAARTTGPVTKGDVVFLSAWMRAVETGTEAGEAYVQCVFEKASPPYTKSLSQRVSVQREWRRVDLPCTAQETYEPGQAQACFQLGFAPQVVEIADTQLLNYGRERRVQDLPQTRFSYAGREPDAAWRRDALARIEQTRKADLTVTVTDAAGQPVDGARVRVRLTRHAYAFGSAVAADALLAQTPDGEAYRGAVTRLFNRVVMENDLKWGGWEARRERAMEAVKWLRENQLEVRGHCLVWPSWKHTPGDLAGLKDKPDGLRKRIADHVTDEAGAMAGKLVEWDVINEPFSNHDVMDVLGNEVMAEWFRLARQADPQVRLFINDYPILTRAGSAHLDHFEKTIRFLLDRKAPLEGIGVQCHYGTAPASPADLLAGLDRLAAFGLPIEATEFDVDTPDEELQADYVRDHLLAFFSHPATSGVIMWGFWEARHWKPAGALYRRDWSPKPAGRAWEDLVLHQWWTDVTGQTAAGRFATRGFLGRYEVTVEANGKTRTATTDLGRAGQALRVALE